MLLCMRRSTAVLVVSLSLLLAGCAGIGANPTEDINESAAENDSIVTDAANDPDESTSNGQEANEQDTEENSDTDKEQDTDHTQNTDDGQDTEDDQDADDQDAEDGQNVDDQHEAETHNSDGTNPTVDGELEIHHIDVGQADSTLIITPDGETILIDTGDWRQSGQEVIDYLDDHNIDRIDHLVATHAHADHIGGHDEIIEYYETERDGIGAAYDSGVAHTSATYDRYLDAIEEHDVDLFEVQEGDELPIEDDQLTGIVLNPPEGDSGSDLHSNSVAIAFEFGDFRYLTTGDAEANAEDRMVEEWSEELDADAYHAGHHGSSTSSTQPFIDEVDPSIAIISSAQDSQYGHPHDETLEMFSELGIETYWTGLHEDIVLITDGQDTTVKTTSEFSSDPLDLLEAKPSDDDTGTSYQITVDAFEMASTPLAS